MAEYIEVEALKKYLIEKGFYPVFIRTAIENLPKINIPTVCLVDGHIDNADRCVSCGEIIPEGAIVCPSCERRWG